MKLRSLLFSIGILSLLILMISPVAAQTPLTYGNSVTAELTAEAQQAFYTFSGSAGDLMTLYLLGHTADFAPTIALTGEGGQLAFSNGEPLTPFSNDASMTFRLPDDGSYGVLVGSSTSGTYTLALSVATPAVSTVLLDAVTLNIPVGAPQQTYSIATTASGSTSVTIQSQTPDFEFSAWLRNPDGKLIAAVVGGVDAVTWVIPAAEGNYELLVTGADRTVAGSIVLSLGGVVPAVDPLPDAPAATEEAAAPSDPNACIVTSNQVNVRSGPGTNYNIVGSLNANNQFIATGQNNGWYYGTLNGVAGWVSSGVVESSGACSNLPFVEAASAPPPQATEEAAPPTATTEQQQQQQQQTQTTPPTATATTAAPTATETSQTAPPDDNISVDYSIKSNNPQSVTSAISYPDGDTQDAINYTLTDYDSVTQRAELRWTLFCNGDTDNVSFRRGNREVGGCNSSYTETINAGNGSGGGSARAGFNVVYTGGDHVYVDWTLQVETISCAPVDC